MFPKLLVVLPVFLQQTATPVPAAPPPALSPDPFAAFLAQWGPALLVAIAGYTINRLNNQGVMEKAAAQALTKINENNDRLQTQLDEERTKRENQGLDFARERGGLNEKVNQLSRELEASRTDGRTSRERLVLIENELSNVKSAQNAANEQLLQVTKERDGIKVQLDTKHGELEIVKATFQKQINELTTQIQQLQTQLDERDKVILEIRQQLEGKSAAQDAPKES